MSIIGKLNRLIFGASGDPAKQAPMQSALHPEQAKSSKAGDNASRFSESDILAVKPADATSDANRNTINELQNMPPPVGKTVGELQNEPMSAWGNNDVITGLQFCATMQLRTPLRVLLRHGEIHTDRNTKPPRIALEPWEGIWLPKPKTFRELGVDMDEPSMGTMASNVGQIPADGGDYLPFLIAVREIVELHDSIESRIKRLSEIPMAGNWQTYLDKLWGMGGITGRFFPDFISTIPGISIAIRFELTNLGLDTPNRIAAATDEILLSIKGIGQSKLKAIRDYCAGITYNRDADTVENVIR